ncbi:MAG: hypothetical protein HXY42_04155 [Chloroflexi bacterium]|nr:hypothetical protein [Chloroflexota bacterium]
MSELDKRFHRIMGGLIGNETFGASLEEEAANQLLAWGESETKKIVQQTIGMDEETAEAYLAPRLRALRLMLRAFGRWVGETNILDDDARLTLWNLAEEQAKVLFGESFSLPRMEEATAQLQSGERADKTIAWLKRFIEENRFRGS